MAPVKKELANKKVKFIYLTNQTSPENTWHHYIQNVKGEHYRLNPDQWRYLKNKFQVNGIPHVVLVDKTGRVVDPNYHEFDNNKIKERIEQLL